MGEIITGIVKIIRQDPVETQDAFEARIQDYILSFTDGRLKYTLADFPPTVSISNYQYEFSVVCVTVPILAG